VQLKQKLLPQLLTLTRCPAVSQLSAFISRVEISVVHFYCAMLAQSAVMRLHVVRPSVRLSVCLSVTIRYRIQIGWNSLKIISRPNLRPLLWLTPTWAIWCNGNTPKI